MVEATDTAVATEAENEVTIEDAGPAKKRIKITVPAEIVTEKLEESFSTLGHEAQLPGFRKGRAPRALIERRFGSTVLNETRNQIVADAYSKAIEAHKLRTVGDPDGEELKDLKVEAGKPLTFTVEVEVAPEFELPEVKGIKVKKPIVEVAQKHIDEEIARQSIRHGSPEEVEGEVQPGDRVAGTALVTNDKGETVNEMAEAVVAIPLKDAGPKGHVLGLLVEDMFALFKGKKVGDSIAVQQEIPESDERPSLRGRTIKIDFTINRGVRVKPASTSEIMEVYGFESEDELRDEVKKALEGRAQQEQLAAMREQAAETLTEMIAFDLPEKLSAAQAARSLDRARVEMLYRGMAPDDVEVRIAEMRGESESRAQERLKMFFILHSLAEHFNVEVNDQEINGRIAMIAQQRGERPEQLRAQLAQQGQIQQIALQIREHKALDRVLDTAEVEEITADEWNTLVEKKMAKTGTDKKPSTKKTTKKSGGKKS